MSISVTELWLTPPHLPIPNSSKSNRAGYFCHVSNERAYVRDAVPTGEADYIPVFLSEVPALFRKRILPLNVMGHASFLIRYGEVI